LLQAYAQRLDRAVGEERRPLWHRTNQRLIAIPESIQVEAFARSHFVELW
jgi:hypothetical protein